MQNKRESGILLHISSLYTDFGIGDFGLAAYNFVDFLKEAKQKIWQILPINPTSFGDSPYQCFSTFAGNTLFICPKKLVQAGLLSQDDIKNFAHNITFPDSKINYTDVITLKEEIFRKAFENFKPCEGYQEFLANNDVWLDDYALFISLKRHFINERRYAMLPNGENADYFYGAVWNTWDDAIASRKPEAIMHYKLLLNNDICYHKFLQYIFNVQFSELKEYAVSHGVQIMGDMPIFVAYDSADVWANPELFLLDDKGKPTVVAGVPPDYFSKDGQLWGNPLYDWEVHKSGGYEWWINRIKKAMEAFDILRLDHFRGFHSYWAIPYGAKTAKEGKWQRGSGRELFDVIKHRLGELPIIAEDLGIITPAVTKLLTELDLPGMRVLQFGFDGIGGSTHLPHNFEMSNLVVYSGTHDNDTTIGWYKNATENEKDHMRRYLNTSGENAAYDLIRAAFLSCAKIAIIPIQDLLSLGSEHRTNTPGTLCGNWQFRLIKDQLEPHHAESLAYLSKLSGR
ncbi:MAG: 4-alpha-glucanotransferase, partial [Defluviitaleaceae bacterium]|nr:4-alpha-glucanotransferase [Defluviitaleaceae bacterium]